MRGAWTARVTLGGLLAAGGLTASCDDDHAPAADAAVQDAAAQDADPGDEARRRCREACVTTLAECGVAQAQAGPACLLSAACDRDDGLACVQAQDCAALEDALLDNDADECGLRAPAEIPCADAPPGLCPCPGAPNSEASRLLQAELWTCLVDAGCDPNEPECPACAAQLQACAGDG